MRVRVWTSTRGNSTPVHRVQRSAHIVYPISPMHHWAEHIKKWFMSSAPMDMHAGCFLKKLLVPPCVSNMIPKKIKNVIKLYIRGFSSLYVHSKRDEEMSTAVIFFSLLFQMMQWGTVQHKAIFLQSPSIYFSHLSFFWTVEWYLRKHTHTHSIIVFTYCCVHLTFKGIVHPIIIYSPSSCPKFLSSAKHRRQ